MACETYGRETEGGREIAREELSWFHVLSRLRVGSYGACVVWVCVCVCVRACVRVVCVCGVCVCVCVCVCV